jgi:hypothetical protein
MTIVVFKPRANLSAEQNAVEWIAFARRNHPFGADFDWTSNEWDLTCFSNFRAPGLNYYRVHFSSSRDTTGSSRHKTDFLRQPFLDFAKAVISETHRLKGLKEYNKLLLALRVLEEALLESGDANVARSTPSVFDSAANRLRRLVDPWAYGKALQTISELLDKKHLAGRLLQWNSPFKYKKPGRSDSLESSDDWRASKLPDIRTILALAEVNNNSKSEIDRAVTAWMTLALYAPSRCTEVLSLPVDCWTELNDGEESVQALRWRPAKGGNPMVKLASGENALHVARAAVGFLVEIGKTAREAAQWYHENPGQLYLPLGFEHLRGEALTVSEIGGILGWPKASTNGLNAKNIFSCGKTSDPQRRGKGSWAALFRFEDVERYVLDQLPPTFPWHDEFTGLYMHEALFVVPMRFFVPNVDSLANVPQPVSTSMINHQLGSNPGGRTVFSRNRKFSPDGKPWEITTHQARHLLNTLAQAKYLPQSLIALWSGRANKAQNGWYDHTSPEVHIEAYLQVMNGSSDMPVIGPLNDKILLRQQTSSISARDVLREEIGAIHVTKYGLCRHNYALTPCPKQKDCASCEENFFVKGDPKNHAEAKRMSALLSKAVVDARLAHERGEGGAQKWLDLNEPRLRRWEEVLRMHEDDSIDNGTLCTLPPLSAPQSEVGFALSARNSNRRDDDAESLDLVRDMMS